tara:strand:+ start:457 stop:735 length:279 start_codon:yes stop_codon:yes gene_type:complete
MTNRERAPGKVLVAGLRVMVSNGWTQKGIAEALGTHPKTVGAWLGGKNGISNAYRAAVERLIREELVRAVRSKLATLKEVVALVEEGFGHGS